MPNGAIADPWGDPCVKRDLHRQKMSPVTVFRALGFLE